MVLDLYRQQQQRALAEAARRPVQELDPGFGGALAASWNAVLIAQSAGYEQQLRIDTFNEIMEPYRLATGDNSVGAFEALLRVDLRAAAAAYEPTRQRYNAWAETAGVEPLPDSYDGFEELILQRRREAYQETQQTLAGSRTAGAAVGGMLGGTLGSLADPIVVVSLFFGAAWSAGILRTALTEMGIGFAADFASLTLAMERIRGVEPEFGFSDILQQSLMTGGASAVLAGGIKGIAATWALVRGRPWVRTVRDAGEVVEREAAFTPRATSPQAAGALAQGIEQGVQDLTAGRPVTVPPAAQAQVDARMGRVFDADGREITVRYEVVPAADLRVSHTADFNANPDYPAALQPRDRTRAASQDQVTAIAARLNPDLLGPSPRSDSGAPIVGPDGIVESGNARVMAIMSAYRAVPESASRYRAWLERQGFDVAGVQDPVLIARRETPLEPEQRTAFAAAANRSTAARMGSAETAAADARLIDEALMARLEQGEITSAANRPFVRGFLDRLPKSEQGEMLDKGGDLSAAGVRRVSAAMLARAFGDPALLNRALEDADSNIKNIAGALTDAAGRWMTMRDAVARGEVARGMDITPDLLDAVRAVMRARDQRTPVSLVANQAEMFGGPSELSKLLLRAMYGDEDLMRPVARSRLAALLASYADEALRNVATARLFGEPLGAGDVLSTALRGVGRQDLASVAASRITDDAVEKLAAEPAVDDAVARAAEEMTIVEAGEGVRMVRVKTGEAANGAPIYSDVPLQRLMDEADMEIAAAREIEACATGRPGDA